MWKGHPSGWAAPICFTLSPLSTLYGLGLLPIRGPGAGLETDALILEAEVPVWRAGVAAAAK
jgi:hypothetical protein